MKKILLSSLVAVMAVTSAHAKIASSEWVQGEIQVVQEQVDGIQEQVGDVSFINAKVDMLKNAKDLTSAVLALDTVVNTTSGNLGNYYTKAEADSMADAKVKALADGQVATNTNSIGNISNSTYVQGLATKTLTGAVDDLNTRITGLQGDGENAAATNKELADGLATKQDVINDLETIRTGAAKGATAIQNFDSLSNNNEEVGTNDGKYVTSVTQSNGKITASVVAFDSAVTSGSTNAVQGAAVYTALSGKADKAQTLLGYGITDAYTKTEAESMADAKVKALADGQVTTNKNAITTLNGADAVEGSVANKIKTATTTITNAYTAYTDAEVKELADGQVAANTAAIALNTALRDAIQDQENKVDGNGKEGTYTLTALVSATGVTEFKWEKIDR